MVCEMMGGDIELNFQGASAPGHYVQSPYNYTPKLGRRLIRSTYIDLGLGILDYLQRIDHAQADGRVDTHHDKSDEEITFETRLRGAKIS
jgi:hypothetical protein